MVTTTCFLCGQPLPAEERVAVTGFPQPHRPGEHDTPVLRFHPACAPALAADVLQAMQRKSQVVTRRRQRPELFELTPREMSILAGLVRGETNYEIGRQLGIGERTVKNAVSVILEKIGARSRAGAAACAVRLGLVE